MTPSEIQPTITAYVRSVLPQLAKLDGKYVPHITVQLTGERRRAIFNARTKRPRDRSVVFVIETIEWDFSKEEPFASQITEYQQRVEEFIRQNPPPCVDAARIVRVSTRPASPVQPLLMQHEIDAIRAGIEAVMPIAAHWNGAGGVTGSWEVTLTEELERSLRA